MTKRASGNHATTDHRSERPDESEDQGGNTADKPEERIRREPAEAHVRDAGRKARERSEETLQSFGDYPAIH